MLRILMVDDDPLVLTQHRLILESAGYATACATTVAEAISLLAYQIYDAVIADYQLPDGLGTQLLWQGAIRRGQTRLLLVSGAAEAIDTGIAGLPGLIGVLVKPVTADELLHKLDLSSRGSRTSDYPRLITLDERESLLHVCETWW